MTLGIVKNNKHSFRDFGLTIATKNISTPKKIKIKEEVPFMSGTYDFSMIYGEQTYEERDLVYTFNLITDSKVLLNIKVAEVAEWLLNGGPTELYDDVMVGYHFNAECIDFSFDEKRIDGQITAKFKAYPFKIHSNYEGRDIWDEFNFELDMAQDTGFDVAGSKKVNVVNQGSVKVIPQVICTAPFDVIKNNITYKFVAGTTTDFRFELDKGDNNLELIGNGNIKFNFRREIL